MAIVPIKTPVGSNPGKHGPDGMARLINCYAEDAGEGGKIKWPLKSSEGLTLWSTLTNGGAMRGFLALPEALYAVSGQQVFRIDNAGTATAIGGIPGTNPVYMVRNRNNSPQILCVTDGLKFVIQTGAIASLDDPDLPPPLTATFLDGYGIMNVPGGKYYITSLDDFTAVDALDFASAEGDPDELVRVYARGRELLLMGEKTIEFHTNTGGSFPFSRLGGGVKQIGCLAPAAVASVEDAVVFVASDGTVRLMEAYSAQRVSNHAVERSIEAEADKTALTGFTYARNGHWFYCLSGAGFTWVFDLTLARKVGAENAWHERQSYGLSRWRAQFYVEFAGKRLVGDYEAGKIYALDEDAYDENGATQVMTVRLPVHAYPHRIKLHALYVDTIPGTGLNSTDDHDSAPKAMIRTSKNSGKTWGPAYSRGSGAQGEWDKRVSVKRLGSFGEDGAVIEVAISAAAAKGITGMAANIEQLKV